MNRLRVNRKSPAHSARCRLGFLAVSIVAVGALSILGGREVRAQGAPPQIGASSPFQPNASQPVDPKLVGVWEAAVPSPQGVVIHMRAQINANGTFQTTFPGSSPVAVLGSYAALHGVWLWMTATGASDSGSYNFTTPDQVTMIGRYGPPVTWQRVSH